MDDTTDTLTRPTVGFPPPSINSSAPVAPWPGQISRAGPSLPTVTPAAPPPAGTDSQPFSLSMFSEQQPAPQRRKKGGVRRGVVWFVALGVLAGLGYAGVVYGPEVADRVTGAEQLDEPAAPLAFPTLPATSTPVRSASFVVSRPDAFGGTQDFEVHADFESGVTHVTIPRADTPDVEVLSVWDQAFIRRVDEPTWYALPRGDFPIDQSMGRARWVRTIDELVPAGIRQFTTVDAASESTVGTDAARRLVVSTDTARLVAAQTAPVTEPADGAAVAPASLAPGVTVQPGPDSGDRIEIEIWVDEAGIVRRSVMPAALGGETITVTSVSPDAWEPAFPTPDVVQPLTAQALFRLGL